MMASASAHSTSSLNFKISYGISLNDTRAIARAGSVAITRWTNQLRAAQREVPGHEAMMCATRRAAVTQPTEKGGQRLLFVPAGFDATRSLEDQGEHLWYSTASFPVAGRGAAAYARVVRGFDVARGGIDTEGPAVTLDGGCGRGGPLVCGCFNTSGKLMEIIAVGGHGAIENLPLESRKPLLPNVEPRLVPAAATPRWTGQFAASA